MKRLFWRVAALLWLAVFPVATGAQTGAVADYFLHILHPGGGPGNLSLYRAQAINFLNTG